VVDDADTGAENLLGKAQDFGMTGIWVDSGMNEHLVGSGGKSVDETEPGIVVEMVVSAAQDQTDSKKSLDGYAIPDCKSWSKDCKWVWCMRHSYSPETFEFDILDTPQTDDSDHGSRYNPGLPQVMG